ncbi:MAG: hypothetical protein NZ934_01030, partial [Hadesarchaea archaeon]|nr:hypothetical protein [Hadesarchaea archaeon]
MRTESYKRGFVSILLALALVLPMVSFVATPVLAFGKVDVPVGKTYVVTQGDTFQVTWKLFFQYPGENGYFTIANYWYHYGDPTENFTVVDVSCKWEDTGLPMSPTWWYTEPITNGYQVVVEGDNLTVDDN